MQPTSRRRRAMIAAAYVAAAGVSVALSLATVKTQGGAAAIWTANGFVAAALVLLPRAWGLGVAAASAVLYFGLSVLFGGSPAMALGFMAANSAESFLAAFLTLRLAGPGARLTNPFRLIRVLLLAIPPAVVAGTAIGMSVLALSGRDPAANLKIWFAADLLGMWLVLPTLLLMRLRGPLRRPLWEKVLLYGVIAVWAAASFVLRQPLLILPLFPLTVWAGYRLGPHGAGVAGLCLAAGFLSGTLFPVNLQAPTLEPNERILFIQALIAALLGTSMFTAMAVSHLERVRRLADGRGRAARRAQLRAEALGKAKGEFLATMSHEIRTPMNSIIGFTQVLLRRDDLPPPVREHLKLVDRASATLLSVVNDILDFSKLEAGEVELSPRPATARTVAEDAAAIVGPSAEAKGLAVEVVLGEGADDVVEVDDSRLRQILLNLLTNAVKFTETGRLRIEAAARPQGDERLLRFVVQDTGRGIPKDRLDRLFRRFSQVDGSVSREFGGTGLGLAICRALVEQMGGVIGVRSTPGQGSTFWVEIPAPTAEGGFVELGEAPAESVGARILLVDDHPMNRELGVTVLGLLGCEVTTAGDGEEAVAIARAGGFDAILMDIHMPRMDGLAATRQIRALPGAPGRTPIIAMSADVMAGAVERCREAGMVDAVSKPIEIGALHAVLARWIGREAPETQIAAA